MLLLSEPSARRSLLAACHSDPTRPVPSRSDPGASQKRRHCLLAHCAHTTGRVQSKYANVLSVKRRFDGISAHFAAQLLQLLFLFALVWLGRVCLVLVVSNIFPSIFLKSSFEGGGRGVLAVRRTLRQISSSLPGLTNDGHTSISEQRATLPDLYA